VIQTVAVQSVGTALWAVDLSVAAPAGEAGTGIVAVALVGAVETPLAGWELGRVAGIGGRVA
jgi:hypothetical protein